MTRKIKVFCTLKNFLVFKVHRWGASTIIPFFRSYALSTSYLFRPFRVFKVQIEQHVYEKQKGTQYPIWLHALRKIWRILLLVWMNKVWEDNLGGFSWIIEIPYQTILHVVWSRFASCPTLYTAVSRYRLTEFFHLSCRQTTVLTYTMYNVTR